MINHLKYLNLIIPNNINIYTQFKHQKKEFSHSPVLNWAGFNSKLNIKEVLHNN